MARIRQSIIIPITLLAAATVSLAQARADRVVAVIPPDSPPTYYRDKQGNPAGFAVEIMNALADRSGLQVEYRFEDGWADIIDMVKSGRADLAPGMGVSKERAKDLSFSAVIDAFPISFFVRAEHPGINRSPGVHTVGVIKGSVAFEKLHDRKDLRLMNYEEFPQGLFDLLAGKIEAFACPAPTLWQLARETGVEDRLKIVDNPIAEIARAVAVRKNDGELLKRLNAAIGGYVGTPEYQRVYMKWYGKPAPYWTTRGIVTAGVVLVLIIITVMAGWRFRSVLLLNRELASIIDQREHAEKALRSSNAFNQSIIDSSSDCIKILDLEGRLQYMSPGGQHVLGIRNMDSYLKVPYEEFWKGSDHAAARDAIVKARDGRFGTFQGYCPTVDGTPKWWDVVISPIIGPDGRPERLLAVSRDITAYRNAEKARQEQTEALRSFLNAITESALLMDREGTVLAANETVAKRLDHASLSIVGKNVYDLLPPDVAQRRKVHLDRVIRSGVPDRFEDVRQERTIDNSVYPVFGPQGEVVALAIIGIDITERKRAELALESSEKKYRMLYDSAIDAIFIVDMNGKFIDVNRTAHERLGYTRAEMMSMSLSELDAPEFASRVGAQIDRLRKQDDAIFLSAHRRSDGTIMPVEINARIIDYNGEKAIFSLVRDITERKLAEQERERLIAELQKALAEIKTLHGILPICSNCKKIRDEEGAWHQLETYISEHTDSQFSHGICKDCAQKLYPEFYKKKDGFSG